MTFPEMRQRRPLPLTPEQVAEIEVTQRDQDEWAVLAMSMSEIGSLTGTLTGRQWVVVFASLRASMAMTTHPGLVRLAHDELYSQIVQRETGD